VARELSRAVGSITELRRVLTSGAHRDQLDAALIHATALGQREAIELLIDHGADPNVRHAFGRTPLFYTANFDVIDTLLRRGAQISLEATGETALEHFLARPRSGGTLPDDALRIVERLLEAGALEHTLDPQRRALVLASACGVPAILELFLRLGVSPNARPAGRDLLDELKYARHRPEVFSMLVKAGIDPNTRNETTTLLIEVCREGDLATARALLDAGAEVNPPLRTTPLSVAEEKGHLVLRPPPRCTPPADTRCLLQKRRATSCWWTCCSSVEPGCPAGRSISRRPSRSIAQSGTRARAQLMGTPASSGLGCCSRMGFVPRAPRSGLRLAGSARRTPRCQRRPSSRMAPSGGSCPSSRSPMA
jgi:hypothetical protein